MDNSKKLGFILVFIVVVAAFMLFFPTGTGKTLLYFNAESDLPDTALYEKQPVNGTAAPVNIIELNKSYDVYFTIASLENKKTDYTYKVSSPIFNATDNIVLSPGDVKTVRVTLAPSESQKWTLSANTTSTSESIIDLTENSWIAERNQFQVLVKEDSLPTIVEEDYHLPVSSELAHFGRIYHVNFTSLDELRAKPFVKEYATEDSGLSAKKISKDEIKLSIVGDKLNVMVSSNTLEYSSQKKSFVVKVFKNKELAELEVDESGKEVAETISFWYKIK